MSNAHPVTQFIAFGVLIFMIVAPIWFIYRCLKRCFKRHEPSNDHDYVSSVNSNGIKTNIPVSTPPKTVISAKPSHLEWSVRSAASLKSLALYAFSQERFMDRTVAIVFHKDTLLRWFSTESTADTYIQRFEDALAALRLVCADAIVANALKSNVYIVTNATQFRARCETWLESNKTKRTLSHHLELLVDDALLTKPFAGDITKWTDTNAAASRCHIHYFKTARAPLPMGASMLDGAHGTAAVSAVFQCRCVNTVLKVLVVLIVGFLVWSSFTSLPSYSTNRDMMSTETYASEPTIHEL